MNKRLLLRIALPLFFLTFGSHLQAQDGVFFLGINPSVTKEPYYKKGEFDVGVVPLVVQKAVARSIHFRLNTIVNLGVREVENRISHLGVELAAPIFFGRNAGQPSVGGFYAAPIFSLTQNQLEKTTNTGLWMEPGYFFAMSSKWGISLGLQVGATHFDYSRGDSDWKSHFGIKFIAGRWFGK